MNDLRQYRLHLLSLEKSPATIDKYFRDIRTLENNFLALQHMLYSVPYEYIKKKVDVRVTDTTIEIFYNHNRIASHRRLKGCPGQYSTITEHMPADHQKYLEWKTEL